MTSRPIFVLTAQISAHLYFATEVAQRISLTAKNARAVTVRAGTQAAGFRAITDFIESLAKSTIESAALINEVAIKTSKMASDQARNFKALQSVDLVFDRAGDAEFLSSIEPLKAGLDKLHKTYQTAFKQEIQRLAAQLEESNKQVRSANVIASTSKIEASQPGNFQVELLAISEDIERAAKEIKEQIAAADLLLRETLGE